MKNYINLTTWRGVSKVNIANENVLFYRSSND